MSFSKTDMLAIRKEMLLQANEMLKGLYPSAAQRSAAARTLVDQALAQERRRHEAEDSPSDQAS